MWIRAIAAHLRIKLELSLLTTKKLITLAIPCVASVALILNMVEKDYLAFYNPLNLIPKDSQLVKILDADKTGCVSAPNQTKPVTLEQRRQLKTANTLREKIAILGNSFCETKDKTYRWITESGKHLELALDHDFSAKESRPKPLHRGLQARPRDKDRSSTKQGSNL